MDRKMRKIGAVSVITDVFFSRKLLKIKPFRLKYRRSEEKDRRSSNASSL